MQAVKQPRDLSSMEQRDDQLRPQQKLEERKVDHDNVSSNLEEHRVRIQHTLMAIYSTDQKADGNKDDDWYKGEVEHVSYESPIPSSTLTL